MRFVTYPLLVSSSSKEVLSLKAVLANITSSHCKGRYCSYGEVPAPCWLWTTLGCILSCLRSSCKCLRLLPGLFWHHVKDTSWVRDQALKLQIAAWSTKRIDSSHLLGLWLLAIFVTAFLSLSVVACLRLWHALSSSYNSQNPSFSLLFLTFVFHWQSWASNAFC